MVVKHVYTGRLVTCLYYVTNVANTPLNDFYQSTRQNLVTFRIAASII